MDQEDVMMENGKRRARRQLTPEEKWEVFLEVTSQQLSQADTAGFPHFEIFNATYHAAIALPGP